jgi:hypothetical protein
VITRLYVENNVGRDIMHVINLFTPRHGVTAVWQNDIHPQMQRPQNGDEWWIKDIAKRGMAILTQDRAILGIEQATQGIITGERQAVIDSQAHVIAFGNANYTTWDKLRCVVNHWDVVDTLLNDKGPQVATLLLSKVTIESL